MATLSLQRVRCDEQKHYVRLTLSRSDRYNAIDQATLRGLTHHLEATHHIAKPLVLTGDETVFSVGADINQLATLDSRRAEEFSRHGHHVLSLLEQWPGVTIAYLNGFALGAGLELALGCDLVIAHRGLQIGLPGLAWALIPCMGGLRRLASRTSDAFAAELFLHEHVLDAEYALRHQLVDRVVSDELMVLELVQQMAEFSPQAVEAIRSIRLDHQGFINADAGARMFSLPFSNGECQRRLQALLSDHS